MLRNVGGVFAVIVDVSYRYIVDVSVGFELGTEKVAL